MSPVVNISRGGAVFSPGPFFPTDITDLLVWFDADDEDTVTKDMSNAVSAWADKGPGGHDLAAVVSNATWEANEQNGRAGILFANGQSLDTAGGAWNQVNNVTLCAVHKPDNAAGGSNQCCGTPYDGNSWDAPFVGWQLGWENISPSESRWWINIGGTNREFTVNDQYTTGNAYISTLWYDGSERRAYVNGSQIFSNSDFSGNISYGSPTPNFMVGVRSTGAAGAYYDGHIHEIVAYGRGLTTDELADLHGYLDEKWAP